MAGLIKICDNHVADTDEEVKQWVAANASLDIISIYPVANGIKIWYSKMEEVTLKQNESS